MQAVQKTYPHGMEVPFPRVASEPLYYGKRVPTHFEGWRALVDQDDGSIVSVVSAGYRMVKHEHVVEATEDALRKQGLEFQRSVTLIKEGAKMVATYTIPSIEVKVAEGDILNPTLVIKNSYDLSWVASILGGIYRLICSNGAYVGTMFEKFRHRHVGQLDAEAMQARIANVADSFEQFGIHYKMMRTTPLSNFRTEKVVGHIPLNKGEQVALQGLKERSSGLVLDLVPHKQENGETVPVWAIKDGDEEKFNVADLFNLLTEFNTHKVGSAVRRDLFSDRIAKGMMN